MGAAEGLERSLIQIVSRCLRVPAHEIDPAAPLTRYGLDSLTALELSEVVAIETGFELAEEVFYDAPSVQTLALQLLLRVPADDLARTRLLRMRADAQLDETLCAEALPAAQRGTYLLTGSNGFLGTHILHALLATDAREVVCLVRAQSDVEARARLRLALQRYGMSELDECVRVLAADIARPRFGLDVDTYDALAHSVGSIVHCAAAVNWAANYEMLRDVNVEATRNLLRFACTGVAKPFHFVSSVAAGYSTRTSTTPFDEASNPADPEGLHLGYGQSKWVAERLVEAARTRGLQTTIYRPTLIAGESDSGIGNDDDLFSRMLRGCVALGYAPDLEWPLDACPVEFVARAVALTVSATQAAPSVMHLRNPHPACWTEAVLWMNLHGYEVKLEPYARWVERVRDMSGMDHPLYALRPFLLHRPVGEGGRYLAELFARPHVRELQAKSSDAALAQSGAVCPRLGARLLECYFRRWVDQGLVRRPARSVQQSHADAADMRASLQSVLRHYFGETELHVDRLSLRAFGSDHSLLGELASWRAGSRFALQAASVHLRRADGRNAQLDLVLKSKLPDDVVLDVTQEVISLCDPALGQAFAAYRHVSEFAGTRARECAFYARAVGATREHVPISFGVMADASVPVLVLERVRDVELADAVGSPAVWTRERMHAVLDGISSIHAQWFEDEQGCTSRAIGGGTHAGPSASAWWEALSGYTSRWFDPWLGATARTTQQRLSAGFASQAAWSATQPHTLIHADFNPRNIVLRRTPLGPRLCALDWELARRGLPQRDIVEFLCFALAPDAVSVDAVRYIEFARLALQRAIRRDIGSGWWHAGVRAAIADFAVTRLPMYFLAHRFRPQIFLERVANCWWQLASVLGTEP